MAVGPAPEVVPRQHASSAAVKIASDNAPRPMLYVILIIQPVFLYEAPINFPSVSRPQRDQSKPQLDLGREPMLPSERPVGIVVHDAAALSLRIHEKLGAESKVV